MIAHVLTTDVYGNVALDATAELATAAGLVPGGELVVEVAGRATPARLGWTFTDVAPGALLAYRDARDFERIHTDILTQLPGVSRVQSTLALRTVKKTTELPV